MCAAALVLVMGLFGAPGVGRGAEDEQQQPKAVADVFPKYVGTWYHYSESKILNTFQFGKYEFAARLTTTLTNRTPNNLVCHDRGLHP